MVLDKIKIWITAFLLLGAVTGSLAQNSQVTTAVILNGDTLPHFTLDAANAIGKSRHAARYYRQERRNVRLEYNVRKVYPYARIAASKISEIEYKLAQTDKESERHNPADIPRDQQHVLLPHPGIPGRGQCLLLAIHRPAFRA